MVPEAAGGSTSPRIRLWLPEILQIFALQIFRPSTAAACIHTRQRWVLAFGLLVAGHILVSTLSLPTSITATIGRLPVSVTDEDRRAAVTMLEQEHVVRSLLLPVRLGIAWAVFALWLSLLCRAFSREALPRYRSIFGLVVHAELFGLLSRAASLARGRWWSTGDASRDLLAPLSLADLLPTEGDPLAIAAAAVSPFSVMYVVTLALGLGLACGFRPWKRTTVAFVAWAGGTACMLGLLALTGIQLHGAR